MLPLAAAAMKTSSQYLMTRVGQRLVFDIQLDLYRHVHRLSCRYLQNTTTGKLMERLRGDINLTEGAFDQLVDILDFGVLAGGFGQADPTYFDGDLNKDDRVDILDFDLLADNYGKTFTDLEANIIPEPGTSVVLELGGLMLLPQQRVKT